MWGFDPQWFRCHSILRSVWCRRVVWLPILALIWFNLLNFTGVWLGLQLNLSLMGFLKDSGAELEPLTVFDLVNEGKRPSLNSAFAVIERLDHEVTGFANPRLDGLVGVLWLVAGFPEHAIPQLEKASPDTSSALALSVAYRQQGHWDASLRELKQIPRAIEILDAAQEAAYFSGPDDIALALLELSLSVGDSREKDWTVTYQRVSLLYGKRGDYGNAIRYAILWIQSDPQDFDARSVLAANYLRQGSINDAYRVLIELAAIGGSVQSSFPGQMAQVYDAWGRLEEALPLYEESVRRNPDDPHVQYNFGWALYRQGDYLRAMPYLQMAAASSFEPLQQRARYLIEQIKANK